MLHVHAVSATPPPPLAASTPRRSQPTLSQRHAADVSLLDNMLVDPTVRSGGTVSSWGTPAPLNPSPTSITHLEKAIAEKEARLARARELREQFLRKKDGMAQSEAHIREITTPSKAVQTMLAVTGGSIGVVPFARPEVAARPADTTPENATAIAPHVQPQYQQQTLDSVLQLSHRIQACSEPAPDSIIIVDDDMTAAEEEAALEDSRLVQSISADSDAGVPRQPASIFDRFAFRAQPVGSTRTEYLEDRSICTHRWPF